MKTILVVGNGFDLAHGLETSYGGFIESIPSNNTFSNLLLNLLKNSQHAQWSDIEHTYFTLLNNYRNGEVLKEKLNWSHTFKNSKELDSNFEQIKELLINYLIKEQERFRPIDSYSNLFSILNDDKTLILDFNYTNTIYKYLNGTGSKIEYIKIHGELLNPENPIIFGYAANDEEAKILSDKNDEYLMKNIKKLCYLLADNEIRFKKHLNESKYDIDVYILGHSCSLSDRLILHELFTNKKVKAITQFHFGGREGYLKTLININRVIDDYGKQDLKDKSFQKVVSYPQCTSMLQHNSTDTDKELFKKYIELIRINHGKKQTNLDKLATLNLR